MARKKGIRWNLLYSKDDLIQGFKLIEEDIKNLTVTRIRNKLKKKPQHYYAKDYITSYIRGKYGEVILAEKILIYQKYAEKRALAEKLAKEKAKVIREEQKKKEEERCYELWNKWLEHYNNDKDLALAYAIYYLNKYVKSAGRSHSTEIYSLKNQWIKKNNKHLIGGKKVRDEYNYSYNDFYMNNYDEYDDDEYDDNEYDNDTYEKIYIATLYVAHYEVSGQKFCFHSYTKPSKIDNKIDAADLPSYYTPLADEVLESLPIDSEELFICMHILSSKLF